MFLKTDCKKELQNFEPVFGMSSVKCKVEYGKVHHSAFWGRCYQAYCLVSRIIV